MLVDFVNIENELASMSLDSRYNKDKRILRIKLILSEFSEVVCALVKRDEVELLDGLADLEYVTIGTAVTFDVPLKAAFDEVHRSNMTKHTAQMAVANHTGDKGKGEGYIPPNIIGLLEAYRAR